MYVCMYVCMYICMYVWGTVNMERSRYASWSLCLMMKSLCSSWITIMPGGKVDMPHTMGQYATEEKCYYKLDFSI